MEIVIIWLSILLCIHKNSSLSIEFILLSTKHHCIKCHIHLLFYWNYFKYFSTLNQSQIWQWNNFYWAINHILNKYEEKKYLLCIFCLSHILVCWDFFIISLFIEHSLSFWQNKSATNNKQFLSTSTERSWFSPAFLNNIFMLHFVLSRYTLLSALDECCFIVLSSCLEDTFSSWLVCRSFTIVCRSLNFF